MPEDPQLIRINKNICRIYVILDKLNNTYIISYNWSSTDPEWVMEKMVWNTYENTYLENTLRDGKYILGLL